MSNSRFKCWASDSRLEFVKMMVLGWIYTNPDKPLSEMCYELNISPKLVDKLLTILEKEELIRKVKIDER